MPRLELDDQTEALVRNVKALEQFCHWNNVYLTDYFYLFGFPYKYFRRYQLTLRSGNPG